MADSNLLQGGPFDTLAALTAPSNANAGGPYSGTVNTPIAVTATVDQGTGANYSQQWTANLAGTFADDTALSTTFTPTTVNSGYILTFTATNDEGSDADTATLDSQAVIVAPTVDAGGPYSGTENTAIQLDGTVTPGSDGSPTLLWTEISALGGVFSDDSIADPTFTPDTNGAYTLRLTVTPNDGSAVFDNATLTSTIVVAPTVDAGGPYAGTVSTAIQLDGTVTTGTDPSPTLLWTEPSALGGAFSNTAIEDPTFTPSSTGAYTLRLSADPTIGAAVTDDASLTSSAGITPPSGVDAGGPYTGDVSTAIQLSGSFNAGSDGTPVLTWSVDSGGTGTFLPNANAEDPTFTPDAVGTYVLRFSVDPDDGPAVEDTASLNSVAVAPTVDAGGPYSGVAGTAIQLDGTIVVGSDASPVILWSEVTGLGGSFSDTAIADPTFTPSQDGNYTLRLSANPSDGSAVTDNASLTASVAPTDISFAGTIADIEGEVGTPLVPVDVSGFFSGNQTPFTYAETGVAWPSWAVLDANTGVITGTPDVQAVTTGHTVTGTDTGTNTAVSNGFSFIIAQLPPQRYFYKMDEGTGDIINNTDPKTVGTFDGTWNDALDWTAIPTNSRYYPVDEGTGNILHDQISGEDATIQNFDEDFWKS